MPDRTKLIAGRIAELKPGQLEYETRRAQNAYLMDGSIPRHEAAEAIRKALPKSWFAAWSYV
jgi:hypothetical protein